jgi:hypothetical protein
MPGMTIETIVCNRIGHREDPSLPGMTIGCGVR